MIRFGIVGAGNIARKFAEDIQVCKDAKVVAVASRSLERANTFKKQFELDYIYKSYDKMAKDNTIDAVYIATPHSHHLEHSLLFLKEGKHVLCEKPLTVNNLETEELLQAAKTNNVLLMEAMWMRFLPAIQFVKKTIEELQEKIIKFEAEFFLDLISDNNTSGRLLNPNLAGGSLLDVGVYPISLYQYLVKDEVVTLNSQAKFHDTGVDVENYIDIRTATTEVSLSAGFTETKSNTAVITLENNIIKVPLFWCAEKVIVNDKVYNFPHKRGGFEYEIDSFVKSIVKGQLENSIMTHQETRKTMKLMDQVRAQFGLIYPKEKKSA